LEEKTAQLSSIVVLERFSQSVRAHDSVLRGWRSTCCNLTSRWIKLFFNSRFRSGSTGLCLV